MNIILYIVAILSLILNGYLYIENRRFRGFEIEKDIGLKEAEIEELEYQYSKEVRQIEDEMIRRGIPSSGIKERALIELRDKYGLKIKKVLIELQYLDKLKKYRWIFSRPKNWDLSKIK